MKTKIYCLLVVLGFLFTACEPSKPSDFFNRAVNYETMVIDSCEYIICKRDSKYTTFSITHKGNCKFCEERRIKLWKIIK